MRFNLKSYDILGVEPRIYFESNSRKTTNIGAITSIITLISVISAVVFFTWEFLFRNSFDLIYNQTTDYKEQLNITNNPIAIGFYDSTSKMLENIDNQIRIYGEFYEMRPEQDGTAPKTILTEQFKLEACNISRHFYEYKSIFEPFPRLPQYYCIPNGKLNASLFGSFLDTVKPNAFLTIKVSKCFNDKNKTNIFPEVSCKNKTEIDRNFNLIYVNVLYLDYDIYHLDVDNPARVVLRSETYPLSSSVFHSYHMRKKIVNYKTDYGFLFYNIHIQNFFQYDTLTTTTDLRVNSSQLEVFGTLIFSLSKISDNYFRKYVKIQNAIANIGGVIEGLFLLFSGLIKIFMQKNYYSSLGILCYKLSDDIDHNNNNNLNNFYSNLNININKNNSNNVSMNHNKDNKLLITPFHIKQLDTGKERRNLNHDESSVKLKRKHETGYI